MTENELKKLKKLNRLIESNLRQKEELQSLLDSISSPSLCTDKVKTSKISNSKLEDRITKFLDLEKVIDDQIDELVDRKTKAKLEFAKLTSEAQLIMELRYIEDKSWEEIQIDTGYSERAVHEIHNKAKKDLTKIG